MDTASFEEWLYARRLGDNTISKYQGTLKRALVYADVQGWDLNTPTAKHVRELADSWPQTRSSLAMLRSTLGHYWAMLDVDGPINAILLPSDTGVEEYKGLEDDEAAVLEATAATHEHGLVVLIGLYLGLRRAETAGLQWEHFDRDWVTVVGKGRRRRTLPVHPVLAERLTDGEGFLFPSRDGQIRPATVNDRVHRVADTAGLRSISSHCLRHTCATRLYEQTNDIRLVQRFLGHSSTTTTERYTRVTRQRLAAGVATIDYRTAA